MASERNICYVKRTDDYVVTIQRFGKIFRHFTNSLEEAIELRDRVEAFIAKRGRIPSKKELRIKRRINRNKKDFQPCVCSKCGKSYDYKRSKIREIFASRGNICGKCIDKERRQQEFLSENEKHISIDRARSDEIRYRVSIVKGEDCFIKTCPTMEEAKTVRSSVIQFYKQHYRLPNDIEREELFGIKRSNKSYKINESEISNRSNTVVRNVSYNESGKHYSIQITRDRKRFHAVRVDFEEAVKLRNAAINFYHEFNRLPSIEEATKYMKGARLGAVN